MNKIVKHNKLNQLNGTAVAIVCCLSVFPQQANSAQLDFPGLPIKQINIDGTWKKSPSTSNIDKGTGIIYSAETSAEEIGQDILDGPMPPASAKVFSADVGPLGPQAISQLGKNDNPWILRYCAERGKPAIDQVRGAKFLITSFSQEERIRTSTPKGAMCIAATKYEAHAFAMNNGKLLHIYLIRNDRTEPNSVATVSTDKRFRAMLSTIRW
jgi:hypothetical protein